MVNDERISVNDHQERKWRMESGGGCLVFSFSEGACNWGDLPLLRFWGDVAFWRGLLFFGGTWNPSAHHVRPINRSQSIFLSLVGSI